MLSKKEGTLGKLIRSAEVL